MLYAKIIVNPAAGACSTRRKWHLISRLLKGVSLSFDYEFTEGKGHAIELAKKAVADGYNYLVSVGGDGTAHEVANGILASGKTNLPALGIISTGTGSDLVRSAGIPRDYQDACSCFASPRRLLIDVGIVQYHSGGKVRERFFLNCAGIGFDATVVGAKERLPRTFGGTVPYVIGLLRSLLGYRNKRVTLRIGDKTETARVLNTVVANGSYMGGGMHIAPLAKLDDALLDVLTVGDISKLELLKAFPSVYKGTHLTHPMVRLEKTDRVSIESSEPFLVHADGELLGEGPAYFRIVPAALTLLV